MAALNGGDLGFEASLFKAADKLRGSMEPSDYKHVALGLIFLRHISGSFEAKRQALLAEYPEGAEDPDEYLAENVFWVPAEARWSHLQANAKQPSIGKLIDEAKRSALLAQVQHLRPRRTGGGSAGNTVVALSQLGGRGFYSCRVADDELGAFYRDDLQAQGVASNLQHTQLHPGQTGTCLVLVTPDAERTMCTYLGATAALDPSALHPQDIARSQVYYMEGYLASSPTGLQAALQGLDLARQSGVRNCG